MNPLESSPGALERGLGGATGGQQAAHGVREWGVLVSTNDRLTRGKSTLGEGECKALQCPVWLVVCKVV